MMPSASTFTVFLLATLAILITPGPAVLYIVTRSIHQGRVAGVASVFGIAAGTVVHLAAAVFGLSALLVASPAAFSILKYAGAMYLIYLGLRTWMSRRSTEHGAAPAPDRLRKIFAQGVVVNVLNPKTTLFFFAFLPQFVDPRRGPVAQQVLFFGTVLIVLAIITDGAYAFIAGDLGRLLQRHPGYWRRQPYIVGSIYVALGMLAAIARVV